MQELLAEFVAEGLPVVGRTVAAIAFTLLGGAAELSAASSLGTGAVAFGLWKVYIGALALYAGTVVFGPWSGPSAADLPDAEA